MIRLTRLYADFRFNDKTEPLYVDENSIISVSTSRVDRSGFVGHSMETEITISTGDKYMLKETVEQVFDKIKQAKAESNKA